MMARGYDIRPSLEGYDALTIRGLAKFAVVVGLIFAAQFVGDQYGLGGWGRVAIQVTAIGVGLKVMWMGAKTLMTGETRPNVITGPRYAEPDRIEFISPRMAGTGEIVVGALLIADALYKLSLIVSE